MNYLLKLLLPVFAVAFVGCACADKSCSKPTTPCETVCKKTAKDESKEVQKVKN